MTLADKITTVRLILAPVFFIFYHFDRFFFFGTTLHGLLGSVWIVSILWFLFLLIEISDFFDGYFARKMGEVSDFGKLYDPFADTLTQLSLFLCFVIDGIFAPLLLLVVFYREFGILFLRNLYLRKGVTLAARVSGKVKTVSYIIAIGFALLASSIRLLFPDSSLFPIFSGIAGAVFLVSVLISVISFFDYVSVYRKIR